MTTKRKKREKKPRTLAAKLFFYFSLFTLFILIILWLFQTVFMNTIYRRIKLADMRSCADYIAEAVQNGNVRDGVAEASNQYSACISVYRIKSGSGQIVASSHIQTSCMIHNLSSDEFLNNMYSGAEKETYFFKQVELKLYDSDVPIISGGKKSPNPSAMVCASVKKMNQSDYLILIDSEILPLIATTRTLTYQLSIITVILFFASLIMSFIISDRIAKPFKKMTGEASRLAEGRYDVNFGTQSFAEAKELGETLNYAAGELSKLDTMQKELIANISHDLRTPLTLITGYSEVMRDIPGEMTAENMQIIIDETERLSSLVSDLLELSRLTNGQQKINPEHFSLTEVTRQTLSRYTKLVENDGYKFVFNAESDVSVYADKTRLLQVIYNLINNAINYTGDDKTVTVTQSVSDGKVRISVSDTGAGIPADQLPMIWERYYKVHDFHNRGKVGTGLGLSIVKNILQMHGADFGVTSREGEGSTFWFELPTDSAQE